ncbi:SWIM zinc finger family protein [Paenibacillus sp. YIM B09110]|uniref:SWIM zinc finger family protein n=1 Tax=Paenibacillus sp. YIM B09110 TaxID=3126102 RepID=UPI00301DDFAC
MKQLLWKYREIQFRQARGNMIALTEAYIDSLALNAASIKNGKDLVRKNSFPLLNRTEDDTLLFGECKGSGKEPYRCSADFIVPDQPVFRCSCPSRQFPCKHILGLLYAAAGGQTFHVADIPSDIAEKREKAEKREEKKKESAEAGDAAPPKRKVNKSALAKKLAAQLEGIELTEKLLKQLVTTGLAAADARTLRQYEEQAKQLGNSFVPGLQASFRELVECLRSEKSAASGYIEAAELLTSLYALLKRGRDYLTAKIGDPELAMNTDSAIEEKIGHAWQFAELREAGQVSEQAELMQLSFRSYTDASRGEFVDEGYWIQLNDGQLVATRTYRPFRAAKFIKEDDSYFHIVQTKELAVYPGEWNRRARWEDMTLRETSAEDRQAVRKHAVKSYPDAIKTIKNVLKNPLSDKNPVMLLHAARIGQTNEGYAMEDEQGKRIALSQIDAIGQSTLHSLPFLHEGSLTDCAVLVMFEDRLDSGRLHAQPLALINEEETIRLLY